MKKIVSDANELEVLQRKYLQFLFFAAQLLCNGVDSMGNIRNDHNCVNIWRLNGVNIQADCLSGKKGIGQLLDAQCMEVGFADTQEESKHQKN